SATTARICAMPKTLRREARVADDVAEVRPDVAAQRLFEDVRVRRPERGSGLVAHAGAQRGDDPFLEPGARVSGDDGLALALGERVEITAGDVVLHAEGHQPHLRWHVRRDL